MTPTPRLVLVTATPLSPHSTAYRLLRTLMDSASLRLDDALCLALASTPPLLDERWLTKAKTTKKGRRPDDYEERDGWWCSPALLARLDAFGAELRDASPTAIIAVGDLPLWAITGHRDGVDKWRGSRLTPTATFGLPDVPVVPILTPERLLMAKEDWIPTGIDLSRVARALDGDLPPPSPPRVLTGETDDPVPYLRWLSALRRRLADGPLSIACDIETSQASIDCIGLAVADGTLRATEGDDLPPACVIPFAPVGHTWDTYWAPPVFEALQEALREVLLHPAATIVGQNFFYDSMWLQRAWGWHPPASRVYDTMIAHHALYVESPKALDYLASLYVRDYVYWKDERGEGAHTRWIYCGKDCLATLEVAAEIRRLHARNGTEVVCAYQLSLQEPILATMMRGLRTDAAARTALSQALRERQTALVEEMKELGLPLDTVSKRTGDPTFFNSPTAKKAWILSHGLTIPKKRAGRTSVETLDAAALRTLAAQKPDLLPAISRLIAYTQCGKFRATFIDAKASSDGRIRTSYNIAGTHTYRLSSSTLLFEGTTQGCNLQNLPKGPKYEADSPYYVPLPNVKSLYLPDPDFPLAFDLDLDRADLQVVAWEADEPALKDPLRRGLDLHLANARILFGLDIADSDLIEGAKALADLKARYGKERQLAKMACHAMNYGTGARTLARGLGKTVREAEAILARWFGALPGLARWHASIEGEIRRGYLQAITGHRRYLWGRIQLPEALAWKPQVTVGFVINTLWKRLHDHEPSIQVLAQVHDSLFGQSALGQAETEARLRHHARVELPYSDPLVIPVGIAYSRKSWGDCKEGGDT